MSPTLEAGQRLHDPGCGCLPVEALPGPPGDNRRPEPVQDDRGVAMGRVDGLLDLVQPVPQRGVVGLSRGSDVRAEEPHVEPAEPSQRPEALSLAPHRINGRVPIDAYPKVSRLEVPRPGADAKRDRDGRELTCSSLEKPLCLARRLPADLDSGDPDSVGETSRRAGERESEHKRHERRDRRDDGDPLPENAAP